MAPVANGSEWTGESFHEHEFVKDGHRHIRVGGREFLTSVTTDGYILTVPLGSRLAVIPVAPDSLGGRLAVFSDQFEQHRLVKCRIIYEPVVPTTTTGALVMYYRNDVGTTDIDLGRDELVHAATHPSFVQTSVWDAASIDIRPSDANLRYFNDESGDFRQQTQGLIVVEAGDPLTPPVTYGNLYIEYDFEFFAPELTYDIVDTPEMKFHINKPTSGAHEGGSPFRCLSPAYAGFPSFSSGPSTSPVAITDADLDYIYILIVESVTASTWPLLSTAGASSTFQIEKGMAFYGRVVRDDSPSGFEYSLEMFTSLADASNGGAYGAADSVPGQLIYAEDFTWSGSAVPIEFRLRRWHAPDH